MSFFATILGCLILFHSGNSMSISQLEEKVELLEKQIEVSNFFKHRSYEVTDMQFGFQTLNTKVIFQAVRTTGDNNNQGWLWFDKIPINIGGGLDEIGRTFTAPVSGIYRLSFTGNSATHNNDSTRIEVRKNGAPILNIYDGNEAENSNANNVASTWLMNLSQNDEVTLHSDKNLYARSTNQLIFTGELIHITN